MAPSRRPQRAAVLLAGALAAAAGAERAAATEAMPLERAVKAAFLYKFTPFVTWPAEAFVTAEAPLRLCVAAPDPLGAALDETVAGQRLGARPIEIVRLEQTDRQAGCHILYAAAAPARPLAAVLRPLQGLPVLTVTDGNPGPHDERGIIHFEIYEGRVRFHVDEGAAARNGLGLSSRLLGLALSVRPAGAGSSP